MRTVEQQKVMHLDHDGKGAEEGVDDGPAGGGKGCAIVEKNGRVTLDCMQQREIGPHAYPQRTRVAL